ncbi:hypothetical protein [Streptomyces carpinensis]|uniref:Uncharacterized protein n=1 Tax=Streptomyces carpinensis TaxID=66369 RepID=A0ABV1WAN9_9ACTN|nr:hypothetical protein [Streptomyces carpinensis]
MRSAGDDDSSYGDDDSSYGDDDHKGEDCDCKRGPQGFQGEQGEQGFQGFQGFQGEAGGAGEQGPQGFQGNQGPQGFQGAQGGSIETYIVTGNTVTTEGTPSTATCNTGDEVTGGGFTVSGPGNSTSVGSSTPFISAMEGGPEGWQATGAHFAGPNSEVIAFAVCAKTT